MVLEHGSGYKYLHRCDSSYSPSAHPNMLAVAYLVAFALTFVSAKPLADSLIVFERRDTVPAGFVHSGAAPSAATLNLRINLVQNDLAGLETALNAAAFPDSPSYGKWLSKEEVNYPSTVSSCDTDRISGRGLCPSFC
jgi:hypothetical protein